MTTTFFFSGGGGGYNLDTPLVKVSILIIDINILLYTFSGYLFYKMPKLIIGRYTLCMSMRLS